MTAGIPEPPPWASNRPTDQSLVEYTRNLGSTRTADGELATVELVQTIFVDHRVTPPAIDATPAQVYVNGYRYDHTEATALATLLTTGIELLRPRP
jgi:hypothetical protein